MKEALIKLIYKAMLALMSGEENKEVKRKLLGIVTAFGDLYDIDPD